MANDAATRQPPPIGLASLTYPKGTTEPPNPAAEAPPGPRPTTTRRWPVRFTGSGSEYFRIWIVNLLLILVTLTLYYPWAKVRKLRYFYGNTLVGDHAIDFHGDPRRMLRGYLLVGALLAAYTLAGNLSPTGGLIALAIITPLWPLLFRASMRFRLSQTSWRGLRFAFDGSAAGAYKALLPAFVPALLVLLAVAGAEDPPVATAAPPAPPTTVDFVMFALLLGSTLCVPWMWWAIKRYQHDHYRYAGDSTRLRAGVGTFYKLFFKVALVTLVAALAVGALLALMAGAGAAVWAPGRRGGRDIGALMIATFVAIVALYGLLVAVVQPYFASRLQNLVWSRTEARTVRFESALRFGPLFALTMKNWLLIVMTLGLYWPFAAVALARLKLHAVTVVADPRLDELVDRRRGSVKDATGDVAADVFGIDMGL